MSIIMSVSPQSPARVSFLDNSREFHFSISDHFNFTFTSRKKVKGYFFTFHFSKKVKAIWISLFFSRKKSEIRCGVWPDISLSSKIAFFWMWNFSKFKFYLCTSSSNSSLWLQINIVRGTTDPGIASLTWIKSPAEKQANSVERKIQYSIGSNFDHKIALREAPP